MILSVRTAKPSLSLWLSLSLLLLLACTSLQAQTVFTYQGGVRNWSAASAWAKSGDATTATYPGQQGISGAERVVIASGKVTVDVALDSISGSIQLDSATILVNANSRFAFGRLQGNQGKLLLGGATLSAGGLLQVDTLIAQAGSSLYLQGDHAVDGLFSVPASVTTTFWGANTVAIRNGGSFGNLVLAKTNGAEVQARAHVFVAGATTIGDESALMLSTYSHSLGTVSGTGTLGISAVDGGTAQLPQGTLTSFLQGGTVTYYGDAISYAIGSVPTGGYYHLNIYGAGTRTLTAPAIVRGNLYVSSTFSFSSTVNFRGALTVLAGGFVMGTAGSSLQFTNPNGQTIGGQPTGRIELQDVVINNGGANVQLALPIRINGLLNFASEGRLIENDNDITLGPLANISAVPGFSPTTMIVQDGQAGEGSLIKEGTTSAGFTGTAGNPFIFPIGTGTRYTPAQITPLAASVAGTGSIAVKTIPLGPGTDVLRRAWRLHVTGLSNVSDAQIKFTFDGAEVSGAPNSVTRTLNNTYYSVTGGFYSGLTGRQTFGVNTPGNTELEGSWSLGRAGSLPRTYYSFQSGPYDSSSTWTTDPSGARQLNPPAAGGPDRNDVAVVLPGHNVVMGSGSKALAALNLRAGGVLDVDTTTGNSFGLVSGQGTLRLAGMVLPAGTYADFVSAQGGTIDYHDVNGKLPTTQLAYCNLTVSGTGVKTLGTAGNGLTYRINGNLAVKGGTLRLGSESKNIWLSVRKNVTVANGDTLMVGAPRARHNIDIAGNFINNGVAAFTSRRAPFVSNYNGGAPTDGYAAVRFIGATDNLATCNGPTAFYSLEVNKGVDATYKLVVSASDTTNFSLLGNNAAPDSGSSNDINTASNSSLATRYGTIVLGQNIRIASITTNQFRINAGAGLTLDGARVNTFFNNGGGGGQGFIIYGRFTMINGYLSAGNSEGVIVRGAGEYIQQGGYVRTTRLRPSTITSTIPRALFDMSGGVLDCIGTNGTQGYYATFSLPYPSNVFKMSGGAINVYGANTSGSAVNQAFQIGADAGNITVSGGTVNLYCGAQNRTNNDMGVYSTAPLYNFNVYTARADSGDNAITASLHAVAYSDENGRYPLPDRDLVVLNDFRLHGKAYFRSLNGRGVRVGGNATFDSASRYEAGTSRFTMGGTPLDQPAQTLTVLNAGKFGKLAFANKSGTVTLAGADSIRVADTLSIDAGTFNDGGAVITCTGTLLNSANHVGSGKVRAIGPVGAGIQYLGGNGKGVWNNLELASAKPSIKNFELQAKQIIRTRLQMDSGVLNLRSFNLLIKGHGSYINQGYGYFSSDGISTDGGLTYSFGETGRTHFILPFVHNRKVHYINFENYLVSDLTDTAVINMVPVMQTHPAISGSAQDALNFYWKLKALSPVLILGFPITFSYNDLDCPPGGSGADSNYVAARYSSINTWSISQSTSYIDTANNFFTGAGTFSFFNDGDYTAGRPRVFGTVSTYETISNYGDWNAPATWKRTVGGVDVENPSTSAPNAASPVIIHAGHTVNVPVSAGAITVASLRIDASGNQVGNLYLDTTCTPQRLHNFNIVYPGVPASGQISISSNRRIATFPNGDFANFLGKGGGTVYYFRSRTAPGFTLPATRGAGVPITSYNHLWVAGNLDTLTLPPVDTRIYNGLAIGSQGVVAFNGSAAGGDLQVDSGEVDITGTLMFGNAGSARSFSTGPGVVDVVGALACMPGGTLNHTLTIAGNLVNEGLINLQPGTSAQTRATTVFSGDYATSIRSSFPVTATRFGPIIVDKGTGSNAVLDVQATKVQLASDPTGATLPLTLRNGTFKLSANDTLVVSTGTPGAMFQIPATAALWVEAGRVVLNGAGANAGLQLDGTLKLSGTGVVKLDGGTSARSTDNSIQTASGGSPAIEMGGDSLLVGGQIRGNARSASGSLNYSQTRGTVVAGYRNVATLIKPVFEVVSNGSFAMNGGQLLIAQGRAYTAAADLVIRPAAYSVTGGEIALGLPGQVRAGQRFTLNCSGPLSDLTLNGPASGEAAQTTLYTNALQVLGTANFGANTNFNANGQDVKFGGNLVLDGTYLPAGNTTWFNTQRGAQTVSGSGQLSLDDAIVQPGGGSTVNISNADWTVGGDLTLRSGTLNTGAHDVTVLGNLSVSAVHASSGGKVVLSGPIAQTISGNGQGVLAGLKIDNAAGVSTLADLTVGAEGGLLLANGILDIASHGLTLYADPALSTGGFQFSATRMIRTNGASDDAGITRIVSAGGLQAFFPIGSETHYTPALYAGQAPADGSITVRPVNRVHPLAVGGGATSLGYYWAVSASPSLANASVQHIYTYGQASAEGHGNEANYVAARLNGTPQWQTYTNTVDAAANTIALGFNGNPAVPIAGEYTAGEADQFAPITPFISVSDGYWDDTTTWQRHVVPTPAAVVTISYGNTVKIRRAIAPIARITIAGELDVLTHTLIDLGDISGMGALLVDTGQLPLGAYNQFIAPGTGSIWFGVNTNNFRGFTLPVNHTVYNNLALIGISSDSLQLPDAEVTVHGDLTIYGNATNPGNRHITVEGSIFNSGIFRAGYDDSREILELHGNYINSVAQLQLGGATLLLNGDTNQRIIGTYHPLVGRPSLMDLTNLQVDKPSGKLITNNPIRVSNKLSLDRGLLQLDSGANLTLGATAQLSPYVITPASYVWTRPGSAFVREVDTTPMRTDANATLFPVGDSVRYLPINVWLKQGDLGTAPKIATQLVAAPHPARGNASARYLNCYWSLVPTDIGGSINMDVRYRISSPLDVVVANPGNTDPLLPARYNAPDWTVGGNYDSTQLTFSWANVTAFGDFAAGTGLGDTITAIRKAMAAGRPWLLVAPNPGRAEQQHFAADNLAPGTYTATILDAAGRTVSTQTHVVDGRLEATLALPGGLPQGLYHLVLSSATQRLATRFVVE